MPVVRCPACGKTGLSTMECPRCGCDLVELRWVLRRAGEYRAESAAALVRGDGTAALRLARTAWQLRKDPIVARVACAAAALCGLTREASLWYSRAEKAGGAR